MVLQIKRPARSYERAESLLGFVDVLNPNPFSAQRNTRAEKLLNIGFCISQANFFY